MKNLIVSSIVIVLSVMYCTNISAQSDLQFERITDSLWYYKEAAYGGGVAVFEAYPIEHDDLTVDINNRVRKSALCNIAGTGCLLLSSAFGIVYAQSNMSTARGVAVLSGATAICFYAVSITSLAFDRVKVTPDGIILRIGKKQKTTKTQIRQ